MCISKEDLRRERTSHSRKATHHHSHIHPLVDYGFRRCRCHYSDEPRTAAVAAYSDAVAVGAGGVAVAATAG